MVPEGWEEKHFSDIAEINPKKPAKPESGVVSFIPMDAVSESAQLIRMEKRLYDDVCKGFTSFKDNDVLVAKITPCFENGKGAFVANLSNEIGFGSTEFHVLRARKNSSPLFLYYLTTTREFRVRGEMNMQGSAGQKRVTTNYLKLYKVNVPPLQEQKKIAQILSTWDKAITTTEKLLKNSQQQKIALMQQLITGKKRLKGFSGEFKRFHFSQLLEIDKQNLGSKTKPDFAFDYISLSDVSPGAISRSLEKYSFKDAPSRARRIVQDGDILLATVRPNLQGFARVRKVNDGAIASTGFAVLTPKSNVYGDYVYHYLFGAHITGQINALVVGTNYPAINSSDVAGLCIYCPCYEEQKEIAEVLNNCDSTTQSLNNKLEKLKQEKKALMQQLLTGKRRVK